MAIQLARRFTGWPCSEGESFLATRPSGLADRIRLLAVHQVRYITPFDPRLLLPVQQWHGDACPVHRTEARLIVHRIRLHFAQHRNDFMAQPLAQVTVFRDEVMDEQGEQPRLADHRAIDDFAVLSQ